MAYFYTTTNEIKMELFNVLTGETEWTHTFSGYADLDPKDLSKEYDTLNNEIVTDNQGIRMFIKMSIINRYGLNDRTELRQLIYHISSIKAGTNRIRIWPMWESDKIVDTLDCFDCVVDKHHSVGKLHKFLDAGTDIKIIFKTSVPIFGYIPKHPLLSSVGDDDSMDGQVIFENILGDIAT